MKKYPNATSYSYFNIAWLHLSFKGNVLEFSNYSSWPGLLVKVNTCNNDHPKFYCLCIIVEKVNVNKLDTEFSKNMIKISE